MSDSSRKAIEAVLFLADEPVGTADLAVLLEIPAAQVEEKLETLADEYAERGSGIVLRKLAGGWRLSTHPETAPYLERYVAEHRQPKLTRAALETLAIVAYRQPISRAQVSEIRGVASDGVVRTLLTRGLVEEVGRDPGPGLAVMYGTSTAFLERLGLPSLASLPPLPDFIPDAQSVERMEAGLGPGV